MQNFEQILVHIILKNLKKLHNQNLLHKIFMKLNIFFWGGGNVVTILRPGCFQGSWGGKQGEDVVVKPMCEDILLLQRYERRSAQLSTTFLLRRTLSFCCWVLISLRTVCPDLIHAPSGRQKKILLKVFNQKCISYSLGKTHRCWAFFLLFFFLNFGWQKPPSKTNHRKKRPADYWNNSQMVI